MAKTNGSIKRRSFGKIKEVVEMPNLLSVQLDSFEDFLQLSVPPHQRQRRGLHLVFQSVFPVTDVQGIYSLEYVSYSIGNPRYSEEECRERDMTFAAPLRRDPAPRDPRQGKQGPPGQGRGRTGRISGRATPDDQRGHVYCQRS